MIRTSSNISRSPAVCSDRSTIGGRAVRAAIRGFSMVELLVAMTLLSLIVFVLMAVFSSTQRAFRSSVTQTDILEGSRAAMDLITADLRGMTPADGTSNYWFNGTLYPGAVNFAVLDNTNAGCSYDGSTLDYHPLVQSMPASSTLRSNLLEYVFILGRNNMNWTGVGYVVSATNNAPYPIYPLYRFYAVTNIAQSPYTLYQSFLNMVSQSQWTNMSHLIDGVIHFTVRPYDRNGYWMTNTYVPEGISSGGQTLWGTNQNVFFSTPHFGEVSSIMYSNVVPAAVELQMAVLEDRTLQRVQSLGGGTYGMSSGQSNYISQQVGHVQLFRQRIAIPNVDLSAYQ